MVEQQQQQQGQQGQQQQQQQQQQQRLDREFWVAFEIVADVAARGHPCSSILFRAAAI